MNPLTNAYYAMRSFMDTKHPADYAAWSNAFEELFQEDLDKVGGGLYMEPDL